MTPLTALPPNPAPVGKALVFRCGTLVYTRAGLFLLFTWLLWGDFCFSLMENIWPNLLPLMLKSQGASNAILALVITTIPSAMNFVLNPIISTASDRFRSRWGRRIPFLLFATPFVVGFLVLLGFAPDLARMLKGWAGEAFHIGSGIGHRADRYSDDWLSFF